MKECMEKLQEMVDDAALPPHERKETVAPEYAKENRLKEKKLQSKTKEGRNWKSSRDYD
jgi:hypothetical protein